MNVLEMKGIHKSFGDLKVLKGIDLSVAKGEVVAVIGPSGGGKSTLLRCATTLEDDRQGQHRDRRHEPLLYCGRKGRILR